MKQRPQLGIEQLEARETPDVSLLHAAALASPATGAAAVVDSVLPASTAHSPLTSVASPIAAPDELSHLVARLLTLPESQPASDSYWQSFDHYYDSHASVEADITASRPAAATRAESVTSGWQFVTNYARKSIRNDEGRFGPLPDHDDMLQQIFLEWRQQVGPSPMAFRNVLQKDSAERVVLRKVVRRVLDHARYEQAKLRRRGELIDQPAPSRSGDQAWTDLRLDLAAGVGRLSPRERQMLELRSQGMTFEEIGSELGLLKQRVCEMYNSTLHRLQAIYAG